jgi:hypothetical protein
MAVAAAATVAPAVAAAAAAEAVAAAHACRRCRGRRTQAQGRRRRRRRQRCVVAAAARRRSSSSSSAQTRTPGFRCDSREVIACACARVCILQANARVEVCRGCDRPPAECRAAQVHSRLCLSANRAHYDCCTCIAPRDARMPQRSAADTAGTAATAAAAAAAADSALSLTRAHGLEASSEQHAREEQVRR